MSHSHSQRPPGVGLALASAVLFGVSTPLARLLLQDVAPVMLAGILYLGSGIGLALAWLLRRGSAEAPLRRADLPWLAGAILCGGIVAPLLCMIGLSRTPAAAVSLILNLEGVFTALLAWIVFQENFDRRILAGMACITAGGVALTCGGPVGGVWWGALAIAAACLGWALDNNLTRKIAAGDPIQIAAIKGAVAGTVNVGIALGVGLPVPPTATIAAAASVGTICYGASLALFVVALRHVGAARTSAYFSVAPFVGAALSVLALHEPITATLGIAGTLMGIGVWLHVTEDHAHEHYHAPVLHEHRHAHDDEHHGHAHEEAVAGVPHSHVHEHAAHVHSHPHYPDLHHGHGHGAPWS